MATWPASLPAPLVDGYGIEPAEQTVGTDMEVGTQRVRRRSFAQVDTVRFAVNLSDAQMALFRAWFYLADGADGGAGWFTISLWIGRGGGSPIECRFKGTPKWDMTGNHRWLVTGQLEARPYAAQWWDYFAAAEIPSLDLNFAEGSYSYFDGMRTQAPSDPFADFITFTRSTTASYIGADGLLKTAGIDEPRIEYDHITGECKGLLIEESRTNLLTYSEGFDNSAWAKINVVVSPNAVLAPSGDQAADKIVENTDNAYHNIGQNGTVVSGQKCAMSVYLCAGERTECEVLGRYSGNWVIRPAARVNLSEGTIISSAGDEPARIENVGGGWFRVTMFGTPTTTNAGLQVDIRNGGSSTYTGDGTSGLYIWGAQLEVGSFPTSYIKTEASAVTRGADTAFVGGANFSSWYRQDEGTIGVRAHGLFPANTFQRVVSIGDGTAASEVYISMSATNARLFSITGGVASGNLTLGFWKDMRTILAGIKKDSMCLVNDGVSLNDTEADLFTSMNQLNIGARGGVVSGRYSGHISRLTYWPKRLSNAKLQELSA